MLLRQSWLCLLLGLISCDDVLLRSTPETIPIPRVTQSYVAVFLSPNSPTVDVLLTRITSAAGEGYESDALGIPDATVTILREDGKILSVPYRNGIRYQVLNNGFVQIGRHYKLLVKLPGGTQLEGSCTIPIKNIDAGQIKVNDLGDNRLRVSWTDVTPEVDYYAILNGSMQASRRDTTYASIDPLFVLTDVGNDVSKRVYSPTLNKAFDLPDESSVVNFNNIILCRTDSAYFAYHKSVADKEAARENPFAEPINLYSNIKGGYGILASYIGVRVVCKGERIVQVRE
ncbi:DUF4249 family protein [Fibrella sp. WM1]|uniref:DUF4249 family protein n=1 Tax=Fibrella musci TaxID=3242485 RepID=UPI0035201138